MILALVAKRRQSEDGQRKWVNYSCKHGGAWYDVKFVHDATPPKVYNIDKEKKSEVLRSFIKTDETKSNVAVRGGRSILYVEDYEELTTDELKTAVDNEREAIAKFRAARQAQTRNFFAGHEPPADVEMPTGADNMPPPIDDDLPY